MKFFRDMKPIFRKHILTFTNCIHEASDVYTFKFTSDRDHTWKAGQHGLFTFPGQKIKGKFFRGFSLSSAPSERSIMISTRITDKPSSFKKALQNLKKGDTINMRGPFGPFYIDEPARSVVFIAGGIGITPYRAMISDIVNKKTNVKFYVDLLYADSTKTFAYKEYFDRITEN